MLSMDSDVSRRVHGLLESGLSEDFCEWVIYDRFCNNEYVFIYIYIQVLHKRYYFILLSYLVVAYC